MEEKLGIMKKTFKQEEKIAIILSELTKIQKRSTDKQVAEILIDSGCKDLITDSNYLPQAEAEE